MPFPRASGVLLHPTSLPGRYGIGDLGPAAERFVDWVAAAGQRWWQVLPLAPTGYGDSPYSGHSAFAGNPLLISPDRLLEQGLLTPDDLGDVPPFPPERVDYGWVIPWKRELLQRAFARFRTAPPAGLGEALEAFRQDPLVTWWLPDYALFMALKERHGGAVWDTWEAGAARRDLEALARWRAELEESVEHHVFAQWLVHDQWRHVRRHANERGVRILGDIPIFVAYDSADVWSHRELFELDRAGHPLAVAGVPPDYFSPTGQLWGNPLYDWAAAERDGFGWWVNRFRNTFNVVDAVRLDHFRGFAAYWRVPAGEATAERGQWVPAPGAALFETLQREFGELPIVAEDLGIITPDVDALRQQFGFPGMRVLQFAFGDDDTNPYLPHRYEPNTVVYTGTHDNDTTVGWWATAPKQERDGVTKYLGRQPEEIHWDLLALAWESVADTALAPLQDVLGLGGEARMNFPGRAGGNWAWRLTGQEDLDAAAAALREMTEATGRGAE